MPIGHPVRHPCYINTIIPSSVNDKNLPLRAKIFFLVQTINVTRGVAFERYGAFDLFDRHTTATTRLHRLAEVGSCSLVLTSQLPHSDADAVYDRDLQILAPRLTGTAVVPAVGPAHGCETLHSRLAPDGCGPAVHGWLGFGVAESGAPVRCSGSAWRGAVCRSYRPECRQPNERSPPRPPQPAVEREFGDLWCTTYSTARQPHVVRRPDPDRIHRRAARHIPREGREPTRRYGHRTTWGWGATRPSFRAPRGYGNRKLGASRTRSKSERRPPTSFGRKR